MTAIDGADFELRNGEILAVGNMSQNWARTVLDIPVAFSEDLARIRGILKDVAHELWEDPEFRGDILEEPEVWGVEDLGPAGVTIRLVVKTQPARQFVVMRELRMRLKLGLDDAGVEIGPGGGELARLAHIDLSGLDPRIADTTIDVACNWTNVLTGPRGVARVYGPQKGASEEVVERLEHALLPRPPARHGRPLLEPQPLGSHALPDVDVRVADDEHVGAVGVQTGHRGRLVPLLAAGDEVVDQDAEPAAGPWSHGADGGREVVDAVEHLDDDTLDAQVVAPHLLDELGVVPPLDEDPGGPRGAGAGAVPGEPSVPGGAACGWPGGGEEGT